MPVTKNLTQVRPGLNPAVQSVRAWFYSAPLDWPLPPGAMPGGEVALSVAHYCVYEAFTGKNATGASLGRGSVDTGTRTLQEAYPTAADVEDVLVAAFPAPGPD